MKYHTVKKVKKMKRKHFIENLHKYAGFSVDGEYIEFPILFFACSDYLYELLGKSLNLKNTNGKKVKKFQDSLEKKEKEWLMKKHEELKKKVLISPFFKNISKVYDSFGVSLGDSILSPPFLPDYSLDTYFERNSLYKNIKDIKEGGYEIKKKEETTPLKNEFTFTKAEFMNKEDVGLMPTGAHGFEYFNVNGTPLFLNYFRVDWELYSLLISGEIFRKKFSNTEKLRLFERIKNHFEKRGLVFVTVENSTSYEIPLNEENVKNLIVSIFENCSKESAVSSRQIKEKQIKNKKEHKMKNVKNVIVTEVKELVNTSGAADIALGRLLYNNIKSAIGKTVVKISFVDRVVAKVSKKMKYKNEVTELLAILSALMVLKQFYDHKALENVRGYIVNRLYTIGIEATGFDDVLALINQTGTEKVEKGVE